MSYVYKWVAFKKYTHFFILSVFIGQKSIFRRYCIQNVKDGIQIQVYNIKNESVSHFSQFTSVKVKKNLRKSQAEYCEKLRKLRLRQNDGFLIEKTCNLHSLRMLRLLEERVYVGKVRSMRNIRVQVVINFSCCIIIGDFHAMKSLKIIFLN